MSSTESSSSSESTFTDDEVTCPGFRGRLVGGEKWVECPYFKDSPSGSHVYRSTKDATHLSHCRERYLKQKQALGQSIDIQVCRFMTAHHFHVDEIAEHELECASQHYLFNCLEYFIQIPRHSKIRFERQQKALRQKTKKEEVKKKEDDDKKGQQEMK